MLRGLGKRFVYVLVAVLLLAQQGLALHAISHGLDALKLVKQGPVDPRGLPADRSCDLCLTYAQVAAGATVAPIEFVAPVLRYAAPLVEVVFHSAVLVRAYRSRAPPRAI
jgi:hypothetical protein